jgi:hypothetical protein
MSQYMMYFKAEVYDEDARCKRFEYGFIYAKTMGQAGDWADEYYGNDLISIYFEPLEDGPLFTTEQEAADIMERCAW